MSATDRSLENVPETATEAPTTQLRVVPQGKPPPEIVASVPQKTPGAMSAPISIWFPPHGCGGPICSY